MVSKSGATLREVGTTNRTRIADYEQAINERTRLLLRVHRSNFQIVGFTEQPKLEELVALRGTPAGAACVRPAAPKDGPIGLEIPVAQANHDAMSQLLVMALELILAVALMAWLVMRDPAERIDRFYGPGAAYSPTLR